MSFNAIRGIKWEHTARVYPKVKWIWRLQRQIHVNYLETDQDAITHNKKKVERTSFGWNSSPMLIVCPWYRSWTWWDQFGVTDAAFYHPVLKHLKDQSCPNNTWPLQVIPQIKDVVVTTTAANLMSWEHMITSLNIMETLMNSTSCTNSTKQKNTNSKSDLYIRSKLVILKGHRGPNRIEWWISSAIRFDAQEKSNQEARSRLTYLSISHIPSGIKDPDTRSTRWRPTRSKIRHTPPSDSGGIARSDAFLTGSRCR